MEIICVSFLQLSWVQGGTVQEHLIANTLRAVKDRHAGYGPCYRNMPKLATCARFGFLFVPRDPQDVFILSWDLAFLVYLLSFRQDFQQKKKIFVF